MRRGILAFLTIFQSILFAAHLFVLETWLHFWGTASARTLFAERTVVTLLAFSFLAASLLSFRYWNAFTRTFYRFAAAWLGVVNFLFFASIGAWLAAGVKAAAGFSASDKGIVAAWFGIAIAAALWGMINASLTRVNRITVRLPNLPAVWRGRKAAMVSDLHLGHVRGSEFARNLVATIRQLRPEIVFLAGDLYDGAFADLDELAGPLRSLNAPLGNYFVAGNHEEMHNHHGHLRAAQNAGLRLLNNEKIIVDGLQIVGVHHYDAARPERLSKVLESAAIDRSQPSVLIVHAPDQLATAEQAGISLQLSGHTHRGQFFPWTWITGLIYKQFVYGLQRFGDMVVYTSSGAGTWGPPLRVGSRPEIVLIQFESA
jgi:predicted MPP superfamily phosphohydrolase